MTNPKAKAGSQKPKKGEKPKTGRPSAYSLDLAKRICTRLALGESLRTITADPSMPGQSTVYEWLHDDAAFIWAASNADYHDDDFDL